MPMRKMHLACPTERHEPLKTDRAAWEAATENERPWFVAVGVTLMMAECRECKSTLCRQLWPGEQAPARAA